MTILTPPSIFHIRISAMLLFALIHTNTYPMAYFSGRDEMIKIADVIAVVEIRAIKSLEPDKQYGNQQARLEPLQVLKGKLRKNEKLYVPCFFPCAIVKLTHGKHLVFLKRTQNNQLHGFNWHLSYLPITDNTVEWFTDNSSKPMKETKLEVALIEIKAALRKNP